MIGVFVHPRQSDAVKEFFQLFKTPWKFVDPACDKGFNILISTIDIEIPPDMKLAILCSPNKILYDSAIPDRCEDLNKPITITGNGCRLSVNTEISFFPNMDCEAILKSDTKRIVAFKVIHPHYQMVRIGYDIFNEVEHLLSKGQTLKNANNLSLEILIAIIRDQIISAGIVFVEIPPIPYGYSCIACCTHDIDFIAIRPYIFSKTIIGFIYRAIIGTAKEVIIKKTSMRKLLRNIFAVFLLPLVFLRVVRDPWNRFEHCRQIEGDIRSTFFFIPFKNTAGRNLNQPNASARACRYSAKDITPTIRWLIENGCEAGVHGIDSWIDASNGRRELKEITSLSNNADCGIRMHWLCFDENSFSALDDAGYLYDSTFGYNESIGFKAGTAQVFKPIKAKQMLELPLIIQDNALFNSKHMNLSDEQAFKKCCTLIQPITKSGGVVTILWHLRSLAPERLWGSCYTKLLAFLKGKKCWFAPAHTIVKWFKFRRQIQFEKIFIFPNSISCFFCGFGTEKNIPLMILRIHNVRIKNENRGEKHLDIPIKNAKVEIPFKEINQ